MSNNSATTSSIVHILVTPKFAPVFEFCNTSLRVYQLHDGYSNHPSPLIHSTSASRGTDSRSAQITLNTFAYARILTLPKFNFGSVLQTIPCLILSSNRYNESVATSDLPLQLKWFWEECCFGKTFEITYDANSLVGTCSLSAYGYIVAGNNETYSYMHVLLLALRALPKSTGTSSCSTDGSTKTRASKRPELKVPNGGDVVQETISSNVTEDTVTLEFQRSDGTLVTQLIDFRNVSILLNIQPCYW
ncbi:out at first [Carabus blaptoides fortunei]